MNMEQIKKLLDDNKEVVDQINENTTHLQDIEIDGHTTFTSHVMAPFGEHHDKGEVYCGIYTTNMESIISDALISEDGDSMLRHLFEAMRGSIDMSSAFSVTVSKDSTVVRMMNAGNLDSTLRFENVKSYDDLMKLVSMHKSEYVDPILKDHVVLKRIFGK